MDVYQSWYEFIADEIFRNGDVCFNRQGLLRFVPEDVLSRECEKRGWVSLPTAGNGVQGVMIRPKTGAGGDSPKPQRTSGGSLSVSVRKRASMTPRPDSSG